MQAAVLQCMQSSRQAFDYSAACSLLGCGEDGPVLFYRKMTVSANRRGRSDARMQLTILDASMSYSKEDGYVGKIQFSVEGHRNHYEMTLHSKKGSDWGYGLFFLHESGKEEDLLKVEEQLEEDDELFYQLVKAAKDKLPAPTAER